MNPTDRGQPPPCNVRSMEAPYDGARVWCEGPRLLGTLVQVPPRTPDDEEIWRVDYDEGACSWRLAWDDGARLLILEVVTS